jgi:hypothetical protein
MLVPCLVLLLSVLLLGRAMSVRGQVVKLGCSLVVFVV